MRDRRKSKEYFEKYLEYQCERIQKKENKLQECQGDHEKSQRIYLSLMNYKMDLIFAEFSSGAGKEKLKEVVSGALKTACAMEKLDYETLLNLLSISIVIGYTEFSATLDTLVYKYNSIINTDKLLNLFVGFVNGKGRQWSGTFVNQEAYGELDNLVGNDAGKVLEKYLVTWYENRKDMAWYESDKGDKDTYVGYWSFETAALAKIFNVDEKLLSGNEYYPVL